MEKLLRFMQAQDRNGSWLEWLWEIKAGESKFDHTYVTQVLHTWYAESGNIVYLTWLDKLTNGACDV